MRTRKPKPNCPHPSQHVHPTFDARFETCDLCHVTAPAPLLAPWLAAHDASLPVEPPPALFQAAAEPVRVPVRVPVPAVIAESHRVRCPRCHGKRRVLVEPIWPNNAPPAWIRCPRCRGAAAIVAYHVEPDQSQTGWQTMQKVQVIA